MKDKAGKKFEVTASVEFREFYRTTKDEQMKKSIDSLADTLEQTPFDAGDFVARSRWPYEYKKMGLGNIYKANLARGARITYSVTVNRDGTGVVRIVEFFATHKDYAKKFGYDV